MRGCSRSVALAGLALACSVAAMVARAETYPAKPVRVIVAYPAGGATDVIARAVGQRLSEKWGQQVIVENKGGAGTQIGAEAVQKAAADGYTLLATAEATFVVNPYIYAQLTYDPSELVPVTGLGLINQVLVVHPSMPMHNLQDLITQTRARPGELNYATLGVGSSAHLNMEMLSSMAGIKLTPVHYRGGAPALTDVIGGHVPMMFISTTLMAQPWKAGQLRALAVGSAKRLPEFPDLPTVAESGLPGFEAVSWFGLFAPRGTPADVVAKINADVQSVLAEPAFREKVLGPNYYEPITGSPAEFAAFVARDAAKWSKVIKDAKITAE